MNKNYIFVLIAICVAIVIIGIVVSYQSSSITLDQIIKNKDCVALDKWETEHMFDDDLNISSEQLSAAMSLATECVGKALGNMFGNSDVLTDTTDPMVILDELLHKKDCKGVMDWYNEYILDVTLNSKQELDIKNFVLECGAKEVEKFIRESELSTDTTDPIIILYELLNKKDCKGVRDWYNEHFYDVTLNSKQELDVENFVLECGANEVEKFLRESNLSTDTTDPMVVLGKILNKKDCDGLKVWLKDYDEYYKDLSVAIYLEVLHFKYRECKF